MLLPADAPLVAWRQEPAPDKAAGAAADKVAALAAEDSKEPDRAMVAAVRTAAGTAAQAGSCPASG